MKESYKIIMGQIRRERKKEISLVNMLINIRSQRVFSDIYKEDLEQLRFLLNKNKTWHGDVRNYFLRKYKGSLEKPYLHRPFFGHRYLGKREVLSENELPF